MVQFIKVKMIDGTEENCSIKLKEDSNDGDILVATVISTGKKIKVVLNNTFIQID